MRDPLFFLILSLFLVTSCVAPNSTPKTHQLYSVKSDSALFYYQLGWKQIMDEGNYGPAEISYRKALDFDSDFLVGQAVLARLTTDLSERLEIFKIIENKKEIITGDERLILDVYNGLVYFTNVREQTPELARPIIDSILQYSEDHLRKVIESHPDEIYLRCEYFEILHSNSDAATTLKAMNEMCTSEQLMNPFLLGFAASLHAENREYPIALEKAKTLEARLNNEMLPKSHAVYADIYYQMDSLDLALEYAQTAAKLDPRNLDASRLVDKILSQ